MTGFEPRTSGIGSDRSTNWATQPLPRLFGYYSTHFSIFRTIYAKDGFRGFYRGYMASLCTYVPSSASWWAFYHFFQEALWLLVPENASVSHMAVQCLSAMSSGCASSLLTNPLDLVRARVQVNRRPIPEIARQLWRQEGLNIFTKGLTARMSSSVLYRWALLEITMKNLVMYLAS